jgi:hypothetical protein
VRLAAFSIDRVRINQADRDERGHQVQVMEKIYGLARYVLIRLGDEIQDTGLAFELMVETALGEILAETLLPAALKMGEAICQLVEQRSLFMQKYCKYWV